MTAWKYKDVQTVEDLIKHVIGECTWEGDCLVTSRWSANSGLVWGGVQWRLIRLIGDVAHGINPEQPKTIRKYTVTCKNDRCLNPKHIVRDNSHRHSRNRKLDCEKVRLIRRSPYSNVRVAKIVGVSTNVIRNIRVGASYADC